MLDSTTKRCTKCGEEKPATTEHFYTQKRGKFGLQSRCKLCRNAITREWHKKNPERSRELSKINERRRLEKYPEEVKTLARARSRRHIEKDRDRKNTQSREGMQRWRENNRELHRLRESSRRAAIKGLPHQFEKTDWERTNKYFNGCCAYCGRGADFWTVIAADHYIALTDPDCIGTIATNIVPACHSRKGNPNGLIGCNQSKNNRNAEHWLNDRFGKQKAITILNKISTYFEWVKIQ